MRRFVQAAVVHTGTIALAFSCVFRPAGAADDLVPLAHLAPSLGYTYTWIASESAVALTRPGVYVLVRTGNPLYDVNDSVESTIVAPQYRNNDIYVGSALVSRLRTLALVDASHVERSESPGAQPVRAATFAHGSLTVSAVPAGHSDAVVVSGSGPANVPLTITLSADITNDLPRVLLSRTKAGTDSAGNFSIVIPTAPLHLQKSLVLISATSLPGVTEAHTSLLLGPPSPGIAHPVDELPRDFRPH